MRFRDSRQNGQSSWQHMELENIGANVKGRKSMLKNDVRQHMHKRECCHWGYFLLYLLSARRMDIIDLEVRCRVRQCQN
jgi:hypothetical protein